MKYTKIVDEDVKEIIDFCDKDFLLNKLKNKTVLITGASGMIGSYLAYTFIKLNDEYDANIKLKLVVRNENKLDSFIKESGNVELIIQDVINQFNIDGSIDYIVHAASPASPLIMKNYPVETNLANTLGTANTLDLAKRKNSLGYLFISSREIYGEPNENQELFTEDGPLGQVDPLIPRNGYSEGKKAAENLCSSYKAEYNLNAKIVRLAHTYGPGMSIYDGRVQADFLKNVINNENIVLKSDGSSVRTYTYIADAIKAMLLVLFKSNELVYNISDEASKTSIKELAETLVNIDSSKGLELVFDIPKETQKGIASFKNGILSSEKIRKELGWYPKYTIEEGFKRTIKHLEEELNLEENIIKSRKK